MELSYKYLPIITLNTKHTHTHTQYLKQRGFFGVWMEAALLTRSDERQAMVGTEGEEASLLVLGGTHNGYGFGHHQLVRAVSV